MRTSLDVLAEIPCFKCLFWDWKKESHLYCNPNECQKLTNWLMEQAENHRQSEVDLTVVTMPQKRVKEKPNHKTTY